MPESGIGFGKLHAHFGDSRVSRVDINRHAIDLLVGGQVLEPEFFSFKHMLAQLNQCTVCVHDDGVSAVGERAPVCMLS